MEVVLNQDMLKSMDFKKLIIRLLDELTEEQLEALANLLSVMSLYSSK